MTRIDRLVPLLSALALACAGSTPDDPASTVTHIATASAGTLTVELLTEGPRLETGLNPILLRITTASGQVVSDADVTFMPEMAMSGGMNHGAPVIGMPQAGTDGIYRVEVVFQMASSMMATWSAMVGVTRPSEATLDATFDMLPVSDGGCARTFTHFDPDAALTSKYVASLNLRATPRVGLNPVVATLHRMDMMTFAPVTDATMTLRPWMTAMGHGANGSVNPTHASLGRYEGEVAFSMAGTWETTLTIVQGGQTLGAPKFTTSF